MQTKKNARFQAMKPKQHKRRSDGFVRYNTLTRQCMHRLTDRALRVMLVLVDHARADSLTVEHWLSVREIAAMTGYSATHVSRTIQELEEDGWLRTERGSARQRTTYHLEGFREECDKWLRKQRKTKKKGATRHAKDLTTTPRARRDGTAAIGATQGTPHGTRIAAQATPAHLSLCKGRTLPISCCCKRRKGRVSGKDFRILIVRIANLLGKPVRSTDGVCVLKKS